MLKRVVLAAAMIVGLAVPRADAAVIGVANCGTLADVIANGCTVGDKVFAIVAFDAEVGDDAAIAAGIEVIGITDDTLGANFGFRLQGVGGAPLVAADGALVASLAYQVSVLDPLAFLITDLHLGLDTSGDVGGFVAEFATDLQANLVGGVLCADADALACVELGVDNVTDTAFGPLDSIIVTKIIGLASLGGTVNHIDQIVTQQAVPEPVGLLLLGTGLAAVARHRRRRQTR